MIRFTMKPADLAALKKQPVEFQKRLERGLTAGAKQIAAQGKEETAKIYARPIPRRKRSGKPMWKRTGVLRASQQMQKAPGERKVLWAAKHAQRRFGLGVDWIPVKPADGVIRLNNVGQDTADTVEPTLKETIEKAMND